MRRRAGSLLLALATVAACAGCAAMPDQRRDTFGIDFRLPEPPDETSAIVFFVDGLNRQVFQELLAAGRLPTIQKYFIDRGLYADRCIVNIPAVTMANETSFVTGLFAGRHGVTGITWFDRTRLFFRNYEEVNQKNTLDGDYTAPTIFERLGGETTFSLFFQAHRGATKFVENRLSAGPPYFFGWYQFVDRIALWRFDLVAQVAKVQGRFPRLVIAYLLAPDLEAFRSGVSSAAYRRAIEHADAHIGRILRDLQTAGRLDRTLLILASDHGMMDTSRHWSIRNFLRDRLDLAVADHELADDVPFKIRLAYYRRTACVLAGSGERYRAIYLRKPRREASTQARPGADAGFENWLVRPSADDLRAYPTRQGRRIDLIQHLRETEAVDLLAYRAGPNRIHLVTKQGLVELTRASPQDRRVAHRILEGDDPLGYAKTVPASMLDGKPHDSEDWLEASASTRYPDLVPQIMAYFDAPRSGDIIVFAQPSWDFAGRLKGGHGGVQPEEMITVLLMAGPGVPHERRLRPVRNVDVVPTLLGLLGRPVPADLDGRNLLEPAAADSPRP